MSFSCETPCEATSLVLVLLHSNGHDWDQSAKRIQFQSYICVTKHQTATHLIPQLATFFDLSSTKIIFGRAELRTVFTADLRNSKKKNADVQHIFGNKCNIPDQVLY